MSDPSPTRRAFLSVAGLGLASAVAGCSLSPPTSGRVTDESDSPGEESTEPGTPPQQEQIPADSELSELYQDTIDSVAAVRIEEDDVGIAGGTSWVYDDEYLVTNEHVIRPGGDPHLWFTDIGWREATVVGADVYSDLAVLEVSNKPDDATPLSLVEQPRPVGTQVAAIGNPFELSGSFTTGVISGRNRTIQTPGTRFSIADGIQTDAALNPGNSGGPLITLGGRVVGVVNAGQRESENIGFAISAAMVRKVVPVLIERGEYDHSYLGVGLYDVTPSIIKSNDLGEVRWGVYIAETQPDGPADGLLRGELPPSGGDVIVRMDDWPIQNRERLSAFLALETEPGETIEVEVIRDGSREVVDVTIGTRPDPPR